MHNDMLTRAGSPENRGAADECAPSLPRKEQNSSWCIGGGRGALRVLVADSNRSRSSSSNAPTAVAASPTLTRSPSSDGPGRSPSAASHAAPFSAAPFRAGSASPGVAAAASPAGTNGAAHVQKDFLGVPSGKGLSRSAEDAQNGCEGMANEEDSAPHLSFAGSCTYISF